MPVLKLIVESWHHRRALSRDYLPFALRALGVARNDEPLLREAAEKFEAMSLNWHAEQTRTLLAS